MEKNRSKLSNLSTKLEVDILLRNYRNNPIEAYKLTTVTYGTAPTPYLAIRALHETAKQIGITKQLEEIIKDDFYMNDLLSGAESIEECQIKLNVLNVLN